VARLEDAPLRCKAAMLPRGDAKLTCKRGQVPAGLGAATGT